MSAEKSSYKEKPKSPEIKGEIEKDAKKKRKPKNTKRKYQGHCLLTICAN